MKFSILAFTLGLFTIVQGRYIATKPFTTTLETATRASDIPAITGSIESIFIENDGKFDHMNFGKNKPIGFELLIDKENDEGAPIAIIPIFNTTESISGKDGLEKREDFDVEAFLSRLPRFWRYAWRRPNSQTTFT